MHPQGHSECQGQNGMSSEMHLQTQAQLHISQKGFAHHPGWGTTASSFEIRWQSLLPLPSTSSLLAHTVTSPCMYRDDYFCPSSTHITPGGQPHSPQAPFPQARMTPTGGEPMSAGSGTSHGHILGCLPLTARCRSGIFRKTAPQLLLFWEKHPEKLRGTFC